jgi:hypothetical protein
MPPNSSTRIASIDVVRFSGITAKAWSMARRNVSL